MKKIVIIGAGETSLLAYEYFEVDSSDTVVAFAVDKEYHTANQINGLPVVGMDDLAIAYPASQYHAFVAISSGKLNRNRRDAYRRIKSMGYQFASYVSSHALVWRNVEVGENCFILENNVLQPFTKIGNNVTLWSGNHVGHRSVIQDHCFISSHCVISGFCEIGESSFLGVNCTLEDRVKIGVDNFLGAGSLVRSDTEGRMVYQVAETASSKVSSHRLFKVK